VPPVARTERAQRGQLEPGSSGRRSPIMALSAKPSRYARSPVPRSGSPSQLRHSVRRRTSDLGVVNRCVRSGANRVKRPRRGSAVLCVLAGTGEREAPSTVSTRAQLIPRRRSSVGAQRSGVEDVTRSGLSLGCVAHFNRHLPGADTLGPPSPEPSNHQRKPLRWPPIPHDEAATRPALDPPANMAAATDDQVLIAHRAPFRLVLKCDGTVVRVTVSWWRDRPQEPATNIGSEPGNATHPSGDRPRSIRSGATRTLADSRPTFAGVGRLAGATAAAACRRDSRAPRAPASVAIPWCQ
jgi:hypothetical protein